MPLAFAAAFIAAQREAMANPSPAAVQAMADARAAMLAAAPPGFDPLAELAQVGAARLAALQAARPGARRAA